MASLRFTSLAVVFVGAIGLFNSMFTVDQTQQAHDPNNPAFHIFANQSMAVSPSHAHQQPPIKAIHPINQAPASPALTRSIRSQLYSTLRFLPTPGHLCTFVADFFAQALSTKFKATQ